MAQHYHDTRPSLVLNLSRRARCAGAGAGLVAANLLPVQSSSDRAPPIGLRVGPVPLSATALALRIPRSN